ncbi:MAG: hypothetical protein HY286_07725 [Planctomycetes bacterium]|nr:hypothetical protein [Planctomycetota bacterium]
MAVILVVAASAIALVESAEPTWRAHAVALLTAILAPFSGCVETRPALARQLAVPLAAAIFFGALAEFAGIAAAHAATLGLLAFAFGVLGAGICSMFRFLTIAPLAPPLVTLAAFAACAVPFLITRGDAEPGATAVGFASSLFVTSPLAPACAAAGVDILRSDRLYAISTLGSTAILGYPSPFGYGAISALIGAGLLLAFRSRKALSHN